MSHHPGRKDSLSGRDLRAPQGADLVLLWGRSFCGLLRGRSLWRSRKFLFWPLAVSIATRRTKGDDQNEEAADPSGPPPHTPPPPTALSGLQGGAFLERRCRYLEEASWSTASTLKTSWAGSSENRSPSWRENQQSFCRGRGSWLREERAKQGFAWV